MSEIRLACQNRWPDIFQAFDVDPKVTNGRHQPCPFCGGTDRFRYTDKFGNGEWICNNCAEPGVADGFEFLMRFTGLDFSGVAKGISGIIGETKARPPQRQDLAKIRESNNRIWMDSKPLSKGDPVHRYLFSRGLGGISFGLVENIRHHPALPYYGQKEGQPYLQGKHPAMVAMVTTPQGKAATLHLTYLTSTGEKADVPVVRKIRPSAIEYKGGAVRLMTPKPGQVVCVAEGIETALSFYKLHPYCCPWAVLNASNMEAFCPPENETIMIASDNDGSFTGQAAAFNLARKLSLGPEQYDVSVHVPEQAGTDWNDAIKNGRAA